MKGRETIRLFPAGLSEKDFAMHVGAYVDVKKLKEILGDRFDQLLEQLSERSMSPEYVKEVIAHEVRYVEEASYDMDIRTPHPADELPPLHAIAEIESDTDDAQTMRILKFHKILK